MIINGALLVECTLLSVMLARGKPAQETQLPYKYSSYRTNSQVNAKHFITKLCVLPRPCSKVTANLPTVTLCTTFEDVQ